MQVSRIGLRNEDFIVRYEPVLGSRRFEFPDIDIVVVKDVRCICIILGYFHDLAYKYCDFKKRKKENKKCIIRFFKKHPTYLRHSFFRIKRHIFSPLSPLFVFRSTPTMQYMFVQLSKQFSHTRFPTFPPLPSPKSFPLECTQQTHKLAHFPPA